MPTVSILDRKSKTVTLCHLDSAEAKGSPRVERRTDQLKNNLKVSAVVCSLNSEDTITECLGSLRDSGVHEIILVDGGSKDKTLTKAEGLYDVLLKDPGLGLGFARNLGVRVSTGTHILNFGSDNVASKLTIELMLNRLIESESAAVGALTRVTAPGYLGRSINFWRVTRFQAGYATVVGTPSLFVASVLSQNLFDTTRKFSDDGELCDRLSELGHSFYNSEAIVYEIGRSNWNEVLGRWRSYGVSDWETFCGLQEKSAPASRLLKSIAHPFVVELIRPIRGLSSVTDLQYIPFLMAITSIRYLSWFNTQRARHKK